MSLRFNPRWAIVPLFALSFACGDENSSTDTGVTADAGQQTMDAQLSMDATTAPDMGVADSGEVDMGMMVVDAGPPDSGEPMITFTGQIGPLLAMRCTDNCHPNRWSGLELSLDKAYDQLVSQPSEGCGDRRLLVNPGNDDPMSSYLVAKIEGVALCGRSKRMPSRGEYLNAEQIELIRAWIRAGAPR